MAATLELTAKEDISEKLFKLEQQNLRLIEQNKRLAQESGRATREAKSGFEGLGRQVNATVGEINSCVGAIAGLTSAVAIVAALKSGYSEWRSTLEQLGNEHQKFTENLISGLARSRDAQAAGQISARLKQVSGVTGDQARQLYEGVTAANPSIAWDRRMALTEQAAVMAAPQAGQLGEWGALVGQVGKLAPGRSAEGTAGLALGLQQLAGQNVGQLTGDKFIRAVSTMKAAGMDEETAMAQMVVAMEVGQGRPGALISAAEAIDKQWEVKKRTRGHRVLTPEEKAQNRFAVADRPERLRLLDSDKEVRAAVLGDQAIMYGQIDAATVSERAAYLKAAGQPGYMAGQIGALSGTEAGRDVFVGQQELSEKSKALAADKELGERMNRARDRFAKFQGGQGPMTRAANAIFWASAEWERPDNPEQRYYEYFPYQAGTRKMAEESALRERQIDPNAPGFQPFQSWMPGYSDTGPSALSAELKALQNIDRNTRGPQAAGVQANVNSQSESDPNGGVRGVNPK